MINKITRESKKSPDKHKTQKKKTKNDDHANTGKDLTSESNHVLTQR